MRPPNYQKMWFVGYFYCIILHYIVSNISIYRGDILMFIVRNIIKNIL